jgi:hypothetical protein
MQNSSGRTPKRNLGTITLYAFFKHKFHSFDETSTSMKHSPNRFKELCPIAFAKMTSSGASIANAVWVFDLSTLAVDKSDDKSSGSFVTKGDAPPTKIHGWSLRHRFKAETLSLDIRRRFLGAPT